MQDKTPEPENYDIPDNQYDVAGLTDFYAKSKEGSQRILPKEKRRYVMYLRKSTDSEDRQVRSLDDQKIECNILAKQLEVEIKESDIFIESASVKASGNRPIFDDMLLGFKAGKYHGLLAWSPDRLSRNMKEAGEIIEMIDLEQIQDLHFKTYQFENNPNGKMLLGILFATSKQYSDKLSVDVRRGNTGSVRDGKYLGAVRKGYYADTNTGYFIPDDHNWQLLRKAILMKLNEKKTDQEIADFLNDSHFSYRKNQDDPYKVIKMSKKMVGDILKEPFYIGAYKYGKNVANLNEIYNFLPLMTPDEYIALSKNTSDSFNEQYAGRTTSAKRLEFGLLREKVICDFCDKIMIFQRTKILRGKNAGHFMISFYCRNKDCIRHNKEGAIKKYGKALSKSIRAKYVVNHIEWTLRHCTKDSVKAYNMYIERLKQKLAIDKEIAKRKLKDAKTELKLNEQQYSKYQNLINTYSTSVSNLQSELEKLNQSLPTRKEFVELVKSYLEILLKTKDLIEEDTIYQEMVLNLRAGDDAISVIKLNPPYNLMVDLSKISLGRGDKT